MPGAVLRACSRILTHSSGVPVPCGGSRRAPAVPQCPEAGCGEGEAGRRLGA